MKLIRLFLIFFFVTPLFAQFTLIPDSNFEQVLINQGYDSGPINGYVNTANISGITALSINGANISNLTGIEGFSSLSYLSCSNNQLTSLNLSQNLNLAVLFCTLNQITNLNITSNTNLQSLNCSSNLISNLNLTQNVNLTSLYCGSLPLISLNVSQNPLLTTISCGNTPLTTIDLSLNPNIQSLTCTSSNIVSLNLSQCPNLTVLICNSNNMTALDVSQNTSLQHLACSSNNLTSLDITSNTSLTTLYCTYNDLECLNIGDFSGNGAFTNNPNLQCIQSNDPQYALQNFSYNSGTTFGLNCLCDQGNNAIKGNVKHDVIGTCAVGTPVSGAIVHTSAGNYDITDSNGKYTLYADSGIVDIHQLVINNPLYSQQICPNNPSSFTQTFNGVGQIVNNLDFYDEFLDCPLLTISVNSNTRRRCYNNSSTINYCNEGFSDTSNVAVYLELPPYVVLQNTSMPYVITSEGFYKFTIGGLTAGQCGQIDILDSVMCITGIVGLAQCTRAWISPDNECLYNATTPIWSNAQLSASGACIDDTTVTFTITNVGTGNMATYSNYRIYEDGILVHQDSVMIGSGIYAQISIPSLGGEYRIEVDQVLGFPTISNTNAVVHSCYIGGSQTSFTSLRPNEDGDVTISVQCKPIVDSFDPNIKSFQPSALGANNYIVSGTVIDYSINFQNTGTDTAFTVMVTDTISPLLNLSTFSLLGSSNPVIVDIIGDTIPVLKFSFYNINLPDSTTNFIESQGYVRFKLSPFSDLQIGTIIHNHADIYFDYNDPITTNDAWYTIYDTIPTSPLVSLCISDYTLDTITACNSFTWIDGITYSSNTSLPTWTLTNTTGCDSTISLDLTIIQMNPVVISNGSYLSTIYSTGNSYEWIDCNTNLVIFTGQNFYPSSSGSYKVRITKNGCVETSSCFNYSNVGIDDINTDNLKIYPNPTNHILNIEGVKVDKIRIIGLDGQVIIYTSNSDNVDVSNLATGCYFIEVNDIVRKLFLKE